MKRKNNLLDTRGRGHQITVFYMETLLLMVIFVTVILVLVKMFAIAGRISGQAKVLTCAVHLAENAAEAVAASNREGALFILLDEGGMGYVSMPEEGEKILFRARYDKDMHPAPEGSFQVDVSWEPQNEGELVKSRIMVYWKGEEIYSLDTAVYIRK